VALSPNDNHNDNHNDNGGSGGGGGQFYRVLRASHASEATSLNIYSPSGSLVHDAEGSTIQLHTPTTATDTMGGPLPARDQRIVKFGGASAMVHPSTGVSLARVLIGATALSRAVRDGIAAGSSPRPHRRGWVRGGVDPGGYGAA